METTKFLLRRSDVQKENLKCYPELKVRCVVSSLWYLRAYLMCTVLYQSCKLLIWSPPCVFLFLPFCSAVQWSMNILYETLLSTPLLKWPTEMETWKVGKIKASPVSFEQKHYIASTSILTLAISCVLHICSRGPWKAVKIQLKDLAMGYLRSLPLFIAGYITQVSSHLCYRIRIFGQYTVTLYVPLTLT